MRVDIHICPHFFFLANHLKNLNNFLWIISKSENSLKQTEQNQR